jgi:hypothetical protein
VIDTVSAKVIPESIPTAVAIFHFRPSQIFFASCDGCIASESTISSQLSGDVQLTPADLSELLAVSGTRIHFDSECKYPDLCRFLICSALTDCIPVNDVIRCHENMED